MGVSQFTFYSSSDPGNGSDQPGAMAGTVGELLRVLDACLVNGYTGKTAAGWTKPVVNSSNSGCYKQGAGSLCTLHVNDNAAASATEARITGWETLTAVGGVGVGSGQFPLPAQLNSTGYMAARKSAVASAATRPWFIAADNVTFYMWILSGDTVSSVALYTGFGFGDIYSFGGTADAYRCYIYGRGTPVSNLADGAQGDWDAHVASCCPPTNATGQGYMARCFGGGGASVQAARVADLGSGTAGSFTSQVGLFGNYPANNGPDRCVHLFPVRIVELNATEGFAMCRGRLRGVYHILHPFKDFTNNQTFQGSGDFAGKTFMVIKGGFASGMWAVEISNTVEKNI